MASSARASRPYRPSQVPFSGKKCDLGRRLHSREPQALLIERNCRGEIPNAECDHADSWIHRRILLSLRRSAPSAGNGNVAQMIRRTGSFRHQVDIMAMFLVGAEHLLPAIAPLRDMMRMPRNDNTTHPGQRARTCYSHGSRHARRPQRHGPTVTGKVFNAPTWPSPTTGISLDPG
jgi:hypothetical protein